MQNEPHILDNPIFNALNSGHSIYAEGNKAVKFYEPEIASFAGFERYDKMHFNELFKISSEKCLFIIFSLKKLKIPSQWKLLAHIDMFQMVYADNAFPPFIDAELKDLDASHILEMDALVKLTKPGPFCSRTIELSNYTGVLKDNVLVAMAGHRFFPTPYREISAVCTHPDHLGNGYAFNLMQEQIKRILSKNEIPFLHVRNDNEAAINLYKKLGFKIRTGMIAYVITKKEQD